MARQSRSRPTARSSAPAPAPAQARSHTTAAAPGYGQHAPAAPVPPQTQTQSREPGMMAQMAANIGSVAAGSVIGHGISRAIFGGSSESAAPAPVEAQAQAPAPVQASAFQGQGASGISCEVQAKSFTQCLEKADFPSCTWYLEQLKACQAAAAQY